MTFDRENSRDGAADESAFVFIFPDEQDELSCIDRTDQYTHIYIPVGSKERDPWHRAIARDESVVEELVVYTL